MVEATPLRRNREFVLLQAGQLVSTFGSSMSAIAYPLLALALTHSAAKAGYVGAADLSPFVIFNLLAGATADRCDRRAQMILADIVGASAVTTLAVLVLFHQATLWLILVVAFVDSTAFVFYSGASHGAFRSVVPTAQLPAASSAVQARASVVRLAAPPTGGALFGVARFLPFVADAASFVVSTVTLLLMRTRFQEQRTRDVTPLRRQLVEGLAYLGKVPFLRTTVLMIAVSNFTVTGTQLAVIVLAKREGLSSAAVGGFVALVAASTLVGALVSPFLRRIMSLNKIMLSELWAASGYVAFLVWPNVYVLAAAFAAQAFCFPNTDAAVAAYSYALIPDRLIGRAMTASNTLRNLASPLGPLVAGLLLARTSPRLTIVVLMGATLTAAMFATVGRSIRQAPPLSELSEPPAGQVPAG
jgi:Transmembrane secretion effector